MNIQNEILEFKIATDETDLQICFNIRNQVFITEQNVDPKIERDNKEGIATHFIAYLNKIPVGTARLIKNDDSTAKISRVAVLSKYRNKQIGKLLINTIIEHSKKLGVSALILSSQSYVTGFYEGFGFEIFGDEFLDANIPHRMMRLNIE
jgi:predicted GNAT family N-acyltransferase